MPRTPKLRTYDAAVEELGGRPWLPMPEATDRWFLADAASLTTPPSLPGLPDAVVVPLPEEALYDLKKRMSVTTKLCILVVAILVSIAVVAANL
jgi:hypothetical protein